MRGACGGRERLAQPGSALALYSPSLPGRSVTPPVLPRRQALASAMTQALASVRLLAPPSPRAVRCLPPQPASHRSTPPLRQPASRRQASPPLTSASRRTKRCPAPPPCRSPPVSPPPCTACTLPQPPPPRRKPPLRREAPLYSNTYNPPHKTPTPLVHPMPPCPPSPLPLPQTHDPIASRSPLARVLARCLPPSSTLPPSSSTCCPTCCRAASASLTTCRLAPRRCHLLHSRRSRRPPSPLPSRGRRLRSRPPLRPNTLASCTPQPPARITKRSTPLPTTPEVCS